MGLVALWIIIILTVVIYFMRIDRKENEIPSIEADKKEIKNAEVISEAKMKSLFKRVGKI